VRILAGRQIDATILLVTERDMRCRAQINVLQMQRYQLASGAHGHKFGHKMSGASRRSAATPAAARVRAAS
jgi:hypothetical protein